MGLKNPHKFTILKKIVLAFISCPILPLTGSIAKTLPPEPSAAIEVTVVEEFIKTLDTPKQKLAKLEKFIAALDQTSPPETKLHLATQKLSLLITLGDRQKASDFATQLLNGHDLSAIDNIDQYISLMDDITSVYTLNLDITKSFQALDQQRDYLIKNPSSELQKSIDVLLADIYITTMDYQRGIDAYKEIIQNTEYKKHKNYYEYEESYLNNIAYSYTRLNKPDKALEYLERARTSITKNRQSSHSPQISLAFNDANRGRALLLKGEYQQALQLGKKTTLAGEELGQIYLTTIGYRLAGHASYQLGNYQTANDFLGKGIELAEQYNLVHMLEPLYQDLAYAYESQKLFQEALHATRKYESARTAVHESSDKARLALFVGENESLKRQQEINALKRQNFNQKVINGRDQRVKVLLAITAILLLSILAIFIKLYIAQRKSRALLEESEKNAQRANKAKSSFLANMSHEIRTPMNGVLGMADLLRNTSLDITQQTYVDTIHKSGSALLTIINDILDFSKIEAGKLELDLTPCNLKEGIEDVVTLLAPKAHDKNIDLMVRYDPSLPETMVADIGRIRQIITNLVGNAIKFTPQGHVLVDVTGTLKNDMCDITLTITDTGIGIAPDKLEQIFSEFTQAESSTTRRYGGTGLGLAISKSLISTMNGTISVESTPNTGSSFYVNLSLPHIDIATSELADLASNKNITTLIIDENNLSRDLQKEQLEAWNFNTHSTNNTDTALRILKTQMGRDHPFDLVLLNTTHTYNKDVEFIRTIREDEDLKDIKIIVLSAKDNASESALAPTTIVDSYLAKPTRSSLLLKTIISTLEKPSNDQINTDNTKCIYPEGCTDTDKIPTLNILIAEDNEVNRLVLKSFLDKEGFNLTFAHNGREAFEFSTAADFDMIFMDVSMPEMDGIEATQAIRSYEQKKSQPRTPIICLTAHVMAEDKEKSFACGMDDYLPKPLRKTDLELTIEKWRDKKSTSMPEAQPSSAMKD